MPFIVCAVAVTDGVCVREVWVCHGVRCVSVWDDVGAAGPGPLGAAVRAVSRVRLRARLWAGPWSVSVVVSRPRSMPALARVACDSCRVS